MIFIWPLVGPIQLSWGRNALAVPFTPSEPEYVKVSSQKLLRKTLDQVASNNEMAAIAVMKAAERTGDEVLRQKLHRVIQQMNLDAQVLRAVRDSSFGGLKRA